MYINTYMDYILLLGGQILLLFQRELCARFNMYQVFAYDR